MMAHASPLAGQRVLIVEDEYMVAADLQAILERAGANVVGMAGDVGRALELLDETEPDAAVLDLNLAGEMSTPLAAALACRRLPFVIVTGYGESRTQHPELRDAPRTDKPVDPRRLVTLLVGVLRGA